MSDIRPTSKAHPYPFTVVGTVLIATGQATVYYVKNLETGKVYGGSAPGRLSIPYFTRDVHTAHWWACQAADGLYKPQDFVDVPGR